MADRYTVTVNGGIQIAAGNLQRCAVESLFWLKKHNAIYVRPNDDRSVCVEFRHPIAGPSVCCATRHGGVIETPDWAVRFERLIAS